MKRIDSFISIYPLFRVKDGQMTAIKKITDEIISRGHDETGTLLFTAAFSDTQLFLRESYVDLDAFHVHLETVKDILDDFFALLELESLGHSDDTAIILHADHGKYLTRKFMHGSHASSRFLLYPTFGRLVIRRGKNKHDGRGHTLSLFLLLFFAISMVNGRNFQTLSMVHGYH